MDLKIVPLENETVQLPEQLSFGTDFSNRMFTQHYTAGEGWHDAEIGAFRPISLSPATAVLHYSQEIFEGTKAYRRPDGNVNLFRPWDNARRFNQSAVRMSMPQVDEEDHVQAIVKLVELEHEWVPEQPGSSLYIRPTMIATDPYLGVRASNTYLHFVILSPVAAYYSTGFNPVNVFVSKAYSRAAQGGTGAAKTGGNYAASLLVSEEVKARGYQQVLWLDAAERRYVEEVGSMNIAFVYDNKHIVTPELSGSILQGITRDSVLKMAPDLGYTVEQKRVDINDVVRDIASGAITEVFGMGTAAVISPVGLLGVEDDKHVINGGEVGPIAQRLFKELTDIQYGRVPDPYGWTHTIEVAAPVKAGD